MGRTLRVSVIGITLLAFMVAAAGCGTTSSSASSGKKKALFNGKDFSGWKLFVPDETVDVHDVWSVKDGVIHCKGKPNGYIRTKATYKNYKLALEWRWLAKPTNSGVLLHASGPDKVWPKCIECQLRAGSAGDFVLIGGTGITVGGKDMQDTTKQFVVIEKKTQTTERPAGKWNSYEIFCKDDTIRCYVNGLLQNEGFGATETSGWICLQSEGGPIEFRKITLEPLGR